MVAAIGTATAIGSIVSAGAAIGATANSPGKRAPHDRSALPFAGKAPLPNWPFGREFLETRAPGRVRNQRPCSRVGERAMPQGPDNPSEAVADPAPSAADPAHTVDGAPTNQAHRDAGDGTLIGS